METVYVSIALEIVLRRTEVVACGVGEYDQVVVPFHTITHYPHCYHH